jgi:signal transduction histidine kinase/heme-degrading monooxygenase HmoA
MDPTLLGLDKGETGKMIVAMSTFRVANGIEAQVVEAFQKRPHLVDGAPGFLGMETFLSTKDGALFHLVTRWTDADCYHAWHRSAAHDQSHEFIPKGLKLDSLFTQVLEMKRLSGEGPEATFQDTVADHTALLACFLQESENVYLLTATSDGLITDCNQRLARSMKCATPDLRGTRVWPLLTAHDAGRLQDRLAAGDRNFTEKFLLNFVDPSQSPFTLLCHLDVQPGGFTLLGEEPTRKGDTLRDELLQLNNELAVLTRENVRKKRELEVALEQLKQAQSMLVHREKMASLGQMTAGVAHEINNPVSFVLSNHATLQRDFDGLLSLINLVGDSLDEIGRFSPALRERILEKAATIDLSYLVESVPRKIGDNLEGLDRIKKIVLELRNFSRLDEDVVKPANVSEGIASTLRFLGPMIGERGVSVKTTFADMPALLCCPGTLNQAFSNIIANAVQSSRPGQEIAVSTTCEAGICAVTVEDHGAGIAAENLTRVFDPFFTTKPAGEGTGLGLHIARQIVTAHGGEIQISSRLGEGTRVRVELPLQRDTEPATKWGNGRHSLP